MLPRWKLVSTSGSTSPEKRPKRQQSGTKSGSMVPLLFPLPGHSKDLFEVLRLGPESSPRRAENIQHENEHGPGSIQDSKRSSRNGAIRYAPTIAGIIEERAQTTHQPRNKGAPSVPAAPALWIIAFLSRRRQGSCLAHHFRQSPATPPGQTPDKYRTRTGQMPNKSRTDTEQISNKLRTKAGKYERCDRGQGHANVLEQKKRHENRTQWRFSCLPWR